MAERTGIEWADGTWNPWMGCRKVSPGCKNCYMFRDMKRYGRDPDTVVRASTHTFNSPIRWTHTGSLKAQSRIFTCAWSDWFIEEADEWRGPAWNIIKTTPFFTYIILTKRAERISECLPADWGSGYKNVWLLVSTENQECYDARWSELVGIPAAVKGISAEPLLGLIELGGEIGLDRPDWIISGGESDLAHPRKSDVDWFLYLRNQAHEYGIPFFHKQNGGKTKINGAWGGRTIANQVWDEFPKVIHG